MAIQPDSAPMSQRVAAPCTLRRHAGSSIAAEALTVGPRGMRVASRRPLALDETLSFHLRHPEASISGRARVVSQERANVFRLRFERISTTTALDQGAGAGPLAPSP